MCLARDVFSIYFPLFVVYRRLSYVRSPSSGCWRVSIPSARGWAGWPGLGHQTHRQLRALFVKAGRISASCVFVLQGWKPYLGHRLLAQALLHGWRWMIDLGSAVLSPSLAPLPAQRRFRDVL